MSSLPRAREITSYSFLVVFANDGIIDQKELEFMKNLALQDGEVDAAERRVLSSIFARAGRGGLAPEVQREIEQFKKEHGIP